MQEFSAGVIIFRCSLGEHLYLLMLYRFKGDYWDFPRGNVKRGETTKQAAIREVREETGLSGDDLRFHEGFEEETSWFYKFRGETVFKRVTYFLAETEREDVEISEEHVGFRWLNFEGALRLLKYQSSKKMLVKAENFLQKLEELEEHL